MYRANNLFILETVINSAIFKDKAINYTLKTTFNA